LGEVEPSVALPSRPDQVVKRRDVEAVSVDQVFIGSCAGGRAEDLREAAEALAGRRVNAGTRLYVGPASREVLEEIVADGTLSRLLAAGAVLLPTGCGACLGRLGTLGENEVAVATQNRNFTGRMGHPSSRLFLVSPATAAEVAATGRLEPEAT
jgi:homoaconitase/3-isopropylmalate dehydratase large subunit